jgi:glycosyltransferase involved in cell wall biosynthesis
MLDISVSVSITDSESFGVAVIEASACEKPVIVANVGGLPEVVEDEVTGFVVPPQDAEATASALEKLVLNKSLRQEMGNAGRQRVQRLYDWKNNVQQMLSIYHEVLQ